MIATIFEKLVAQPTFNTCNFHRSAKGKLKVVGLCIDPIQRECKDILERDSISWPNICDGAMFEGNVARKLGVYSVPFNILLKNGKIVAKDLDANQLKERLDKLL